MLCNLQVIPTASSGRTDELFLYAKCIVGERPGARLNSDQAMASKFIFDQATMVLNANVTFLALVVDDALSKTFSYISAMTGVGVMILGQLLVHQHQRKDQNSAEKATRLYLVLMRGQETREAATTATAAMDEWMMFVQSCYISMYAENPKTPGTSLLTSHRQPPLQRSVTDQVTMDGAEILKGISCMVEELLVPDEAIFLWYCYVQRHQRPFKGVVARMGQSGETRGTSLAGQHSDISLSHHGKSQTHFAYITTAS
ncbi:hypothetical protein C8R48DRAFT_671992 [Suillus tomentosus]|nr:hypothetical protein C8R48DRAFT_671992 [Suillus tomentosus]